MTKKTNEHSVGKKFPIAAVVAISVAAVLALAFGSYMISYSRAVSLAEGGEYGKAREALFLYELTRKHDERLTAFLDACEIMESGELSEANAAFLELGDYANSPQMVQETDYRQATLYIEGGQFRDAIDLYIALAEKDYKDSGKKLDEAGFALGEQTLYEAKNYEEAYDIFAALSEKGYPGASEMCSEVRYLQAMDCAEKGLYAEACSYYLALEGYSDAESKLAELYDKIYSEAVELYRGDEHITALEYFMLIPHHADAQDYLTLLYLRGTTATRTISTTALIKELVGGALGEDDTFTIPERAAALAALLDFEDAAEILVMHHRIVWEFLKGEWVSEDGYRSFVFEEESYYYLNLPAYSQYEFPHQYSYIENGDFLSYDSEEDSAVAFFTFDIIDANTMNVYCHKDGSTVTLYRELAELILVPDDTNSL